MFGPCPDGAARAVDPAVGTNGIGLGLRGGVTLRMPAQFSPSLILEAGHYFDGNANALASKVARRTTKRVRSPMLHVLPRRLRLCSGGVRRLEVTRQNITFPGVQSLDSAEASDLPPNVRAACLNHGLPPRLQRIRNEPGAPLTRHRFERDRRTAARTMRAHPVASHVADMTLRDRSSRTCRHSCRPNTLCIHPRCRIGFYECALGLRSVTYLELSVHRFLRRTR